MTNVNNQGLDQALQVKSSPIFNIDFITLDLIVNISIISPYVIFEHPSTQVLYVYILKLQAKWTPPIFCLSS